MYLKVTIIHPLHINLKAYFVKKVTIFSKTKKRNVVRTVVGICSLVGLFICFAAPFNAWRNRRQPGSPICCDRPSHSLWKIPACWPSEANDIVHCYEIAVLSWPSETVLWTPRPQDTPAKGSWTRCVWGTPSSPQRPWSHGCPRLCLPWPPPLVSFHPSPSSSPKFPFLFLCLAR